MDSKPFLAAKSEIVVVIAITLTTTESRAKMSFQGGVYSLGSDVRDHKDPSSAGPFLCEGLRFLT
jgi:hypothetical protein